VDDSASADYDNKVTKGEKLGFAKFTSFKKFVCVWYARLVSLLKGWLVY